MAGLSAETLLACWEQGRTRHPLDRALLLHAVAAPELAPETLADLPIGRRNAALLELRRSLFGDDLKCCVECPECAEKLEFSLSVASMLARSAGAAREVDVDGIRLRLPTTRDLACVAVEPDEAASSRALLRRLSDGELIEWSGELERRIALALDEADPCMDLSIDLTCPACAQGWNAAFDVAIFLWEEMDVRARRLLDEVHALARSYAWSEREILALSESRRRAYLDRVLA